jgi:hypothetical protein
MPAQQMNALMALPWTDIAAQVTDEANTAVNCRISDEWKLDKGKKYKVLGVKVKYHVEMKLDMAEFTSSIASPPGYKTLTPAHLVVVAPLKRTWRAGIKSGFTSRLRAWVAGEQVVGIATHLTQTVELFGLKLTGDLKLDVSEPDRPRLEKVRASVRLGIRLRGLLDHTWGPATVGIEFVPPDTYAIRIPLNVPLHPSPVAGLPAVGFHGHLVLIAEPESEIDVPLEPFNQDLGLDHLRARFRNIRVEYDGTLKFTLFDRKVPPTGKRIRVQASIPFRFDPGLRLPTPGALWDFLPNPTNIPKSWGEDPPCELQHIPTPPPDYDFLTHALEIEEGVLPQSAVGPPSPAVADPPPVHHAPDGLIYEIRRVCGGNDHDLPGKGPEYEGYHDTAIWTGHFLAAEAFRFSVTQSTEALQRVRFILCGIEKLFQVTGASGLFARAALRADSPYPTQPSMCTKTRTSGSKCHPGEMEQYYHRTIDDQRWCGFGRGKYPTSRDSYAGLMMGMAFAYKLVPDPQVSDTIRRLVTDAIRYLVCEHKWNLRTFEEPLIAAEPYQKIKTSFIHQIHHQLALLRLGKTVNPEEFGALYDLYAPGADVAWLPIWGTVIEPLAKYYKFNLSHATMGLLLFLEEDPGLREKYKKAFMILRRATRHHRNAHFNLVRTIVELEADREDILDHETSGFSRQMSLREETRSLLWEWLIRRSCIRGPRGLPTERPPDPKYLQELLAADSLNPAVHYTPLGEGEPAAYLVSTYALPVHKRPGNGMDFVWQRPPFATNMYLCGGKPLVGAGKPELEGPALDYLLPFWMAAYLKVV